MDDTKTNGQEGRQSQVREEGGSSPEERRQGAGSAEGETRVTAKHFKRFPAVGIELYQAGKGIPEISEMLNLPRSTVRSCLILLGVQMRTGKEAAAFSGWKISLATKGVPRGPMKEETKEKIRRLSIARGLNSKGTSIKPSGYIEITRGENKGRYQHVVIMEESIGRRLRKHEVVHHKDRNRSNNSPENLQLMTRSSHMRLHRLEGW